MKPWTRFEAFLGKIIKDPEAMEISITPLTRLEDYLDRMGKEFELPPQTSPLNARGYLMSDGTNGAVWVRPLNVMFTMNGDTPYCSKSFHEIAGAINANRPVNAYYQIGNVAYPLAQSMTIRESSLFFFTNVTPYIDDNDQWALTKISCIRGPDESVEIVTDGI